jgi:hypothetical protein
MSNNEIYMSMSHYHERVDGIQLKQATTSRRETSIDEKYDCHVARVNVTFFHFFFCFVDSEPITFVNNAATTPPTTTATTTAPTTQHRPPRRHRQQQQRMQLTFRHLAMQQQ